MKFSNLGKRILKNLSLGLIGSGVGMIVAISRAALLTKFFSIYDYGLLMIAINFFAFFNIIFDLKINDFVFRHLPSYEETEKEKASGLVSFSILVSILISLLNAALIIGFSGFISSFYDDPEVGSYIKIYAIGGVLYPLLSFSIGILRLKNRFSYIIVPQVLFSVLTLVALIYYVYYLDLSDLKIVTLIMALGIALTYITPFLISLRLLNKIGYTIRWKSIKHLKNEAQTLKATLIQTNLASYLKVGSKNGIVFLLGILGTPQEVAIFNLAHQLLRPVRVLQNNFQPAVYPEIVKLFNAEKFDRLKSLIKKVTLTNALISLIMLVVAIPLVKPVLLLISTQEYIPSIPVFTVMIFTVTLQFIFFCFYPMAVVMDKLRSRNFVVFIGLVLIVAIILKEPSALVVAYAQLAAVILTRVFNDVPLYTQLIQLNKQS